MMDITGVNMDRNM
ncbi:hypothetical protein LINPERPRIM_LOCUS5338 [Linum perenne]